MRRGILSCLIVSCLFGGLVVYAQEYPTVAYTTLTKTVSLTSDALTTIWTPASGNRFILLGCLISVSTATNVAFYDNGTLILGPIQFNSTGQLQIGGNWSPLYANTTVPVSSGTKLQAISTGVGTTTPTNIACWGWESPS